MFSQRLGVNDECFATATFRTIADRKRQLESKAKMGQDMYFTSHDAIQPTDLALLKSVLEDVRVGRDIPSDSPATQPLAQEIIQLWQAGFRDADELRAMMTPDLIEA